MQKEVSRCSGQCCKDFTLTFSPMELESMKKQIAMGRNIIGARKWDVEFTGLDTIVDMVEFKRMDQQDNQTGNNPAKNTMSHLLKTRYQRMFHYTCRHFDGQNCTIYETRPQMCRTYPDGRKCGYKGCTRKCEEIEKGTPEDAPNERKALIDK